MEPLKIRLISLLRWSERYTKTDMVYLASGGMWLGVAQLTASGVGFVLTIILANFLPKETLGEYRFLMSAVLILTVWALPGMRLSIIESTPKGFRKNLLVGYQAMKQWAFIGSGLALAVTLYFISMGNYPLAIGFGIAALALPWLDASALHVEFLKALQKFTLVSIYTIITRILLLGVLVPLAFFFPTHAWVLFGAFLLLTIIPNLFFHTRTVRAFIAKTDTADPTLVTYARHLSLMTALGLVALQVDKIFVWGFLGAEELAIFFIAIAFPQEIVRFLAIIPSLALAKFATRNAHEITHTLLRRIAIYFIGALITTIAYLLISPLLFQTLFPNYLEALPYSQVLALTILTSAFLPIAAYFTAHKRTRLLYILSGVVPSVRIVAALVLIPPFGLWGAVYALVLEAIVHSLLLVSLFFYERHRTT